MLRALRSQLRGSVLRGGGGFVSKPTRTCSSRINKCHAVSSFLQITQYEEYSTCNYKELKEEAKEFAGSSHSCRIVEEPKEPERKQIAKGDVIDLRDLLFTENRDYLVKYKDNQKVKAEHLAGKVIVLLLSRLSDDDCFWTRKYVTLLEDQYSELYPDNGFEIVFVAAKDDSDNDVVHKVSQKQFEELFSLMSWTAIPFSDIPSAKSLLRRGFPDLNCKYDRYGLLIVDSSGLVLQCNDHAYDILQTYGFSGYPFSDERISELKSEDDDLIAKPSLHALLASPQRDYLISNKGDKVPIHTLENKVVALYYGYYGYSSEPELKKAYEEMKMDKKNFEVVFVNDSEDKEIFWKTFKNMPWLALPYNDPNNKKLTRIFESCSVIFGPRDKFIPYGDRILENFGSQAYPFTCAAAVNLEIEKTKNMRLEMLLDRNTVLTGKDGYEIPFCKLSGKRVIVIYEMSENDIYGGIKFIKMLKEMYLLWKGTRNEFEVIHAVQGQRGSSNCARKSLGDLPWIVMDASAQLLPGDFFSFSSCEVPVFYSFAFFDRDGKLVRKTLRPMKKFTTLEFPFCGDDLEKQAWEDLSTCFFRDVSAADLLGDDLEKRAWEEVTTPDVLSEQD